MCPVATKIPSLALERVGQNRARRLAPHLLAFGAALLVTLACPGQRYPTTAYRCYPGDTRRHCPEWDSYQCCSDDPAALDLDALDDPALPDYATLGASGTPLFSSERNAASHWGMCVRTGSVPPTNALPGGCPIPCNPTWAPGDIELVCGEGTICCQTAELDASDCVLDTELGASGCWRPASGEDIVGLGGIEATTWSADAHASHQDPSGLGCQAFVEGVSTQALEAAGVERDAVLEACYRQLSVSNQRGFCLGGAGVAICPLTTPQYRDACEQRNDTEGRSNCD